MDNIGKYASIKKLSEEDRNEVLEYALQRSKEILTEEEDGEDWGAGTMEERSAGCYFRFTSCTRKCPIYPRL